MLILSHQGHQIEINPDSLVIIQNATSSQYEQLANEDLKIDFDGKCLYIHSPTSILHEKLAVKLYNLIENHLQQHKEQGDIGGFHFAVHLPTGPHFEPDLVVFPRGMIPPSASVFNGIPTLIIEILSPSTRSHDLVVKRKWFEEALVPEFWFIDIEVKEILYYRKNMKDQYTELKFKTCIKSPALSDLKIDLELLFRFE